MPTLLDTHAWVWWVSEDRRLSRPARRAIGKAATGDDLWLSMISIWELMTVRTPECNGCLTCVTVCPVKDALEMRTLVTRRRVTAPRIALGVAAIFLAVVGYARFSGHWHGNTPEDVFFQLIPNAASFSHPR